MIGWGENKHNRSKNSNLRSKNQTATKFTAKMCKNRSFDVQLKL